MSELMNVASSSRFSAVRRRRGRWRRGRSSQTAMRRIGVLRRTRSERSGRRPASRHSCRNLQNWAGPRGATCGSIIAGAWPMPTTSQIRGGIGRARAGRHPGHWHLDHGAVVAGDAHRTDRVLERRRPGRRRLRGQPRATGRQHDRLHAVRIRFEWEMVRVLKQIAPDVRRAAVLRDPAVTAGIGQFAVIQSVARSVGVDVSPVSVRDAGEIERAVTAFARFPHGGLVATASALTVVHRDLIVTLAARHQFAGGLPSPTSTSTPAA